ncbi:MAG: PrsW family intramembrane metalloprotease [Firmicutes bacterium]|nr:PrsW family intramembrane metalloprotease [Bacillota bacterium]
MADVILMPAIGLMAFYAAAALLPAIVLLRYIYRHDHIEKEPPALLLRLLLGGVLSAFAAILLETAGMWILPAFAEEGSDLYYVFLAFLVVAVSEEGAKLFFLKKYSWHQPAFNYMFDGIVYAVFVSLAAFENVKYVFDFGLSVAFSRAFLAVPAHMAFAVFMGIFYGRARCHARRGNGAAAKSNLAAGFISAVLLHGFYDACLMVSTNLSMVVFVGFVIFMYFFVSRVVKTAAAEDHPM